MRYRSGEPRLPSDLVTSADDPGYAAQGYDRAEHVKHLHSALAHSEECVRCLTKALAALDDEPIQDDLDIEPIDFSGDNVPANPQDRAARIALIRRALRA
jgi:hypothetical protein